METDNRSTAEELRDFLKSRKLCNLCIVILNIAVFFILEVLGNTKDARFMLAHGAMYEPLVIEQGEYYRLFTSMFLHFSLEHLAYNMLLLLFIGDMLEAAVGKVRYLLIYLIGGLAGNLLSLAVSLSTGDYGVSAGASGAIFAVLGALVCLMLRRWRQVSDAQRKRLLLMAVLSLAQGFTETGVDNMAHLGGFLGGAVVCFLVTLKSY